MIIAIDGPSGTGKSTVAREIANKLGFSFFDTGAMYRSFAWRVLRNGVDPTDREGVLGQIQNFSIDIQHKQQGKRYLVDGEDVTEAIRSEEVTKASSQIAIYPDVRERMVRMQREFGSTRDAVFEGRDMGTVVFPKADLKIFLTATEEVRAKRRFLELQKKEKGVDLRNISEEMYERDRNDANRESSPLRQADDALFIDTSNLAFEEVVSKILERVPLKRKMKLPYFFIYWIARGFFKLFFRLKVYGEENIGSGSGILIGNHTSFYDPPVLSISCPEEVHFLARESLLKIPLLGKLIKVLNTHPLSNGASDLNVLRQMLSLLSEGKKLIIFPEGTRSRDGDLQPFKKGFVFLAKKGKCTIYPAYIQGARRAWPATKKLPKLFGKITCVFGTPIQWKDFASLPKETLDQAIVEKCSVAIVNLKQWLEDGAKGTPP